MEGPRSIDPQPGRLLWAKVGDWPWWPSRVVTIDQVPEKVRGALGGGHGVIVRFFEDPPKLYVLSVSVARPMLTFRPLSQRLSEKQLRPWQANYGRFSSQKSKLFQRSLAEANEFHLSLSPQLQSDGVLAPPDSFAAPAPKRRKQAAPAAEPLLADEGALLVARRALGEAMFTGRADRVVAAAKALCRFETPERVIRELQLGKIATLLARHEDSDIAKAGEEYVSHLSGQLVLARIAKKK